MLSRRREVLVFLVTILLLTVASISNSTADVKTWDGRHSIDKIKVSVVYFVPSDRPALTDWIERAEYYCRRIELFHTREFQGQSEIQIELHPEPIVSELTTNQLRAGDANAIFFRTLREAERKLGNDPAPADEFPILLVLSEINWRGLDDFYRLTREDGDLRFEGQLISGEHFPGSPMGGARATFISRERKGWGLVSADGWRVPYRGSDCVVYHEGLGHTVGLPHPEPGNGSVMSLAQYRGWINESWLDKDQKTRLGWEPGTVPEEREEAIELFSRFRALPVPKIPSPGDRVRLQLDWPENAVVAELRVRIQTSLDSPWIEVPQETTEKAPSSAELIVFDRATPVSYRVDARLENGASVELWGYFQVRADRESPPIPISLSPDLVDARGSDLNPSEDDVLPDSEIDLLELVAANDCWQQGEWKLEDGSLTSPKRLGARIEIPYSPPDEYRLVLVVEPIDDPNGLILGQLSGDNRFVTLLSFARDGVVQSAIEDIQGRNVGNESTFTGPVFQQGRLAQVIVEVRRDSVNYSVDGRTIVSWQGPRDDLSLSGYWRTPNDKALFLGSYDCSYRFHRVTLEPIEGEGSALPTSDR